MALKIPFALAISALGMSAFPAIAAVTLSSTPGAAIYAGPTPTYDFETPAPFTGGIISNSSVAGVRAQPLGSTGFYASVGPTDGTPGFLDLASFSTLNSVTFIWGSVDTYNTLAVLDRMGNVISSIGGSAVVALANGNQTDPFTNPLVTLTFTGSDRTNIGGLRFSSTQNAFEIDNVSVAVPEPATWAMLIAGFGFVGGMMRRRRLFAAVTA